MLTTASSRNTEYVKSLGASSVFDHHSPTVVADVIAALRGTTVAGALAIGAGSARECSDVIALSEGRKFVSIVTPPATVSRDSSSVGGFVRSMPRAAVAITSLAVRNRHRRIGTASVFGTTLMNNVVCRVIYQDFLPAALADGRYVAAPPARKGLATSPPALMPDQPDRIQPVGHVPGRGGRRALPRGRDDPTGRAAAAVSSPVTTCTTRAPSGSSCTRTRANPSRPSSTVPSSLKNCGSCNCVG